MNNDHYKDAIEIQLNWNGPYAWPNVKTNDNLIRFEDSNHLQSSGVYLWTVEFSGKYLTYTAGQTRRSFITRFKEHTQAHNKGFFTVFDKEEMKQGRRVEIWHGFFTRKRQPEKEQEFKRRREEIIKAVDEQLASFRIFVAPLESESRMLKRIEGGIMNILYQAPSPISDIPDRGMSLSRRWENEKPVLVRNNGGSMFHGLPEEFEI